jgi:Spy/CpxP family protein refolding chaperone
MKPHTEAQVNREGTMNKLKMLVLAALAAATIGTGGLAAAPSASAAPSLQPHRMGKFHFADERGIPLFRRVTGVNKSG